MTESKDRSVIRLADIGKVLKKGVSSRAFTALAMSGEPYMTLEDIATICGFSPSTLRFDGGLGDLFHAELVEPVPDIVNPRKRVKGYRITARARRTLRRLDVMIDRPLPSLLRSNPRSDSSIPSSTQDPTQVSQVQPKLEPKVKDIKESPKKKVGPKTQSKSPKTNPSIPRSNPRSDPSFPRSNPRPDPSIKDRPKMKVEPKIKPKSDPSISRSNPNIPISNPRSDPRTKGRPKTKAQERGLPPEASPKKGVKSKGFSQESNERGG